MTVYDFGDWENEYNYLEVEYDSLSDLRNVIISGTSSWTPGRKIYADDLERLARLIEPDWAAHVEDVPTPSGYWDYFPSAKRFANNMQELFQNKTGDANEWLDETLENLDDWLSVLSGSLDKMEARDTDYLYSEG